MKPLILIFAFSIALHALTYGQTPIKSEGLPHNVQTQFGWVQGTKQDKVYQFLGIPFAKPPVGALRWKAPEPSVAWSDILLAQKYAPACPQIMRKIDAEKENNGELEALQTSETFIGDEDCLYLNIWTPANANKKPVMVFIHGGGNQRGATNMALYNGKLLVQRGDVVLVTIAYRLGPLGFMAHPGLNTENNQGISGNYGTLDQILALRWVQNNIEAFGGDPNNVTLFGESAGSLNTSNLLTTPLSKGLFHKAILQSGPPFAYSNEVATSRGKDFAARCGCTSDNPQQTIACMRQLSPMQLFTKISQSADIATDLTYWMPNVDGHVFAATPFQIIRTGKHHQVPVMLGTNVDEGLIFTPWGQQPKDVAAFIDVLPMSEDLKQKAKRMYPAGFTKYSAWKALGDLGGDAYFHATVRNTARALVQNQQAPVYRYVFDHRLRGAAKWLGAFHGLELAYVFQYEVDNEFAKKYFLSPEDPIVQEIMLQYWTNFAKTGNPNGHGLAAWKTYDVNLDNYLELSSKPREKLKFRAPYLNLWDEANIFFKE